MNTELEVKELTPAERASLLDEVTLATDTPQPEMPLNKFAQHQVVNTVYKLSVLAPLDAAELMRVDNAVRSARPGSA